MLCANYVFHQTNGLWSRKKLSPKLSVEKDLTLEQVVKKLPEPMIDVLTLLQQSPAIPGENHYTDASAPAARTLKSSAAARSSKLHEQYGIHAPVMTGDHKAVTDQAQGSRLGPKFA